MCVLLESDLDDRSHLDPGNSLDRLDTQPTAVPRPVDWILGSRVADAWQRSVGTTCTPRERREMQLPEMECSPPLAGSTFVITEHAFLLV